MAGTAWFYVRDDRRSGPVDLARMRELMSRGEVQPQTLVWTAGMTQWAPAAQVEALSGLRPPVAAQQTAAHPDLSRSAVTARTPAPAPAPATAPHVAPVAQPDSQPGADAAADAPVAAVPYYGYIAGIPPRAVESLKGHAQPTGERGDWPLDDARVLQFQNAVKLRKKVTSAAQLYRLLLFLVSISLGVAVVVGAIAVVFGAGRLGAPEIIAYAGFVAFSAALVALYYFTWRATMRAHRWAPLTMFIIFLIFAGLYLLLLFVDTGTGNQIYGNVGSIILAFLFAVFAVVSWQSFAAIPKYLAQPAWCQELIVKAGL